MPSSRGSRTGGPQLFSPSLVVVLLTFAGIAGLVVALVAGHAHLRWVVPTLGVLLLMSTGATMSDLLRRRNNSRNRHQVDCCLRIIKGTRAGLTSHWRHGAAVIERSEIRFQRMIGGVRFLPGRRVDLDIVQIGPRLGPTSWADAMSVMPGSEVVRLTTADVVLDAAFPPRVVQWVIEQLHQ